MEKMVPHEINLAAFLVWLDYNSICMPIGKAIYKECTALIQYIRTCPINRGVPTERWVNMHTAAKSAQGNHRCLTDTIA